MTTPTRPSAEDAPPRSPLAVHADLETIPVSRQLLSVVVSSDASLDYDVDGWPSANPPT